MRRSLSSQTLIILLVLLSNGCKSTVNVTNNVTNNITTPSNPAPVSSLTDLLANSLRSQLMSQGLTSAQAEAITYSAANWATSATKSLQSQVSSNSSSLKKSLTSSTGRKSKLQSNSLASGSTKNSTLASTSDPIIILPAMVTGALGALTLPEVGASSDAIKISILTYVSKAFALLAFDANLPALTSAQVQAMFEDMLAKLTAKLPSSGLSVSKLSTAVQGNTSTFVETLNTQVADPATLTPLISVVTSGSISGLGSYSDLDDSQKSEMTQAVTQGTTAGLSNSHLAAQDLSTITETFTSSAVSALSEIVPPAQLGGYVQAVSAGPVSAISGFTTLSSDEKASIAGSSSKGATLGLESISDLTPVQVSAMTQAISTGAISALGNNNAVTAENMGTFVQAISAGPVAAIASFTELTETQKSDVAKNSVLGATLVLGGGTLSVGGSTLTPTQISSMAQSVTIGAVSGLTSILSSEDVSTYVQAISNAPVIALGSLSSLSDADKALIAGGAVRGATAALGTGIGGLGLSAAEVSTLSEKVAQGAIAGLASAGVSASSINSTAQTIADEIQNGMVGAGLTVGQISAVASNIQTAATNQANTSGIGSGFSIDTSASTPAYINAPSSVPPSGLSYGSSSLSVTTIGQITPLSPSFATTGTGGLLRFTVSPNLPQGLILNANTGVISGRPTTIQSSASYTITASRLGVLGVATTTLSVAILGTPPSGLSYSTTPFTFSMGHLITPIVPTLANSGTGSAVTFSVTPVLPTGLTLNTSTGVISGTPSGVHNRSIFNIYAGNTVGTTFASISLAVNAVSPSNLRYSTHPAVYTKGSTIQNNSPSVDGGSVESYSVSPPLPAGLALDSSTGVISGTPTSVVPGGSYVITATNSGGSATFILNLTVNDTLPSGLSYATSSATYSKGSPISENTPSSSGGAVVSYSISPSLPAGLSLNPATGLISGTPTEFKALTTYTVTATNSGGSTTTTISLSVNDNAPSNLTYSNPAPTYTRTVSISTNTPSSTGGAITSYTVAPALPTGLSLNSSTGVISGTPTLITSVATYTITGTNSGGSTSVNINLTVNELPPSNLSYSSNPVTYSKDSPILPNSPSVDGGAVVNYSISPALSAGLHFDTTSGIISGTPTATQSSTSYSITATNSGGSTSASLTVTVLDAAPTDLTYTYASATYTKGTAIPVNSPSSGEELDSYSVSPALPSGLSLDTLSGVISGTPTALSPTATYLITGTNSGGSALFNLTLTVNDILPSALTYTNLSSTYTVGSTISNNSPSSSGGAVVTYSISPALPAGLSFGGTTGLISGTPTAVTASRVYTVTATNSGGSTTADLTLAVNDIPPSALNYSATTATYTKGQSISANSPSSQGGAVVSYSISPALPAGLDFNSSSGIISGTPTSIRASTSYTITATNSGGSTTKLITLTVNDMAPSNLTYSANPVTYTKETAIPSNNPNSTGGQVVSYSVFPSLPSGLSLDPASGVISGTPGVVSFSTSYLITATNSGGSTSVALDITVKDKDLGITYAANPAIYVKGTQITNNFPTSTGGVVSRYAIYPALPAGLSFNTTTGVISGTPTAVSDPVQYFVTATGNGGDATFLLTLSVNDALPANLTYSASPATYTKGTSIAGNSPSSSGGVITSYSISPDLSSGLLLNSSSGVISGTPTSIQAATVYTVTGTNATGSTQGTLTITVNDAAPAGLSYATPNPVYTKGTTISVNNPSQSGGTVVSYSITPSLPAGLSLNTSTGVISGTPTAVTSLLSYTVTATNSGGSTTVVLGITVNDTAPTSLTYTSTSPIYTKDSPISNNSPSSSGGSITSYSVSPDLPAGLVLNPSTGVISGTPTLPSAVSSYVVTGTNSGGSITVTLNIRVNDILPSNLTYSTSPAVYYLSVPITNNSPSSSGGAVISYSISPALSAGLSLNTTSGIISGTPTVTKTATNYTITATNSAGSTTIVLNITVNTTPPLNLTYSLNPAVYTKGTSITTNSPSSTGGAVSSYSITPTLPTGLSLNGSTGNITGNPSVVSATTTYTVTATNSGGSTTVNLQLTVNDTPPSTLTYKYNPADYLKNVAITSNSPTTTGGAITAYSISPALPDGLSMNSTTGIISGTPTTSTPSTNYVVTGSNSGGSITLSLLLATVEDLGNRWTWIGGNTMGNQQGVYGTRGVTTTSNWPGTREAPAYAKDSSGSVLVFGGNGYINTSNNLKANDLWKWDGTNWTWISGSATTNSYGNWGAQGVAAPSNVPSGRYWGAGFWGLDNNFWVFGGMGFDATNVDNKNLNDLWKWDGTNWTWVSGGSVGNTFGNYGTKGVSNSTNIPGGRYGFASWLDSAGSFWIYGGTGYAATTSGRLADLWKWDGTNWTWMAGTSAINAAPNFGSRGVPSSTNTPGGLHTPTSKMDSFGNTWVFGGRDASFNSYSSLWKWDGTNWTWMAGGTQTNQSANYGNIGIANTANAPGARGLSTLWIDSSNNIWVYGGYDNNNYRADLWKWDGINWIWVKGPNTANKTGNYGVIKTPSSYVVPPSGLGGTTWIDSNGDLTFFGSLLYQGGSHVNSNLIMKYKLPVSATTLSYSAPSTTYTRGVPITPNFPVSDSSSFSGYTLTSTLPPGLLFDSITGTLSGTPLAVSPMTTYSVVGGHAGGNINTTFEFRIIDPAPTNLTYSMNGLYQVGYPVNDVPSIGGVNIDSYSISGTLPAGLSFNTATGVISGTPTTPSLSSDYVITANNTGGTTTKTLSITVTEAGPNNLTYSSNPATYYIGYPIFVNTPSIKGGPITGYSVSPSLPDGLTLNSSTGVISGTPTTSQPETTYTVTATGTSGSTTKDLVISVSNSTALVSMSYPLQSYNFQPYVAATPIAAVFSGGPPSSCSVSPTLPSGLSVNSICTISGTPTGSQGSLTTYTVTGTNQFGSVSTNVNLNVAGSTMKWTWMAGTSTTSVARNFGTQGVASTSNTPGARTGGGGVYDSNGNYWIFGGSANDSNTSYNDLWKWDGSNWTWVSGGTMTRPAGSYGTKGVAATSNVPKGRTYSQMWADSAGGIWVYGGNYNGTVLDDIWKWDGTNWTWVAGNSGTSVGANYGTRNVASSSNTPGKRFRAATWKDASGMVWIFGGYAPPLLADLWKWDGVNWTWVTGSNVGGFTGSFGFKGYAGSSNLPPATQAAAGASDLKGNIWIFGGSGSTTSDIVWKWDGTNWTWVAGGTTTNQTPVYGTQGVPSSSNTPGVRLYTSGASDSYGNLWLAGGVDGAGSKTYNDVWKWDGTNWTWVAGTTNGNTAGNFGTIRTPSSTVVPSSRYDHSIWIDKDNAVFIYGGVPTWAGSNYLDSVFKFVY